MNFFNEFWFITSNLNQLSGPNGVFEKFLKEFSSILLPIITFLLNKSLKISIFSCHMEISFVIAFVQNTCALCAHKN